MTTLASPLSRTDRSALGRWQWTVDGFLLAPLIILIVLGVALSFASSPAAAAAYGKPDPFYFTLRQALFGAFGVVTLIAVSLLSPRGVRRVCFVIFFLALAVMITLPFLGHSAKGATRWLRFGPLQIQPSEFLKPALIVMAAWMFDKAREGGFPGVFLAFAGYVLSAGLLMAQPDFGQTILITVAFMACFFVAGVPARWIIGLIVLAIVGGVVAYLLDPHINTRVVKFLGEQSAPGDVPQAVRAGKAIANGGLFGRGAGEGSLKQHVPDMHTDFIYSVGAEEFGLALSLMLIGLFGWVTFRGLSQARRLTDPFEQVAAVGLFVLFGVQAAINVAVNLNLVPTKGMTLPFISYGGSSMLAMSFTMGLALALTRRRPGGYDGSAL